MVFTRMGLADFARTWRTIRGTTEPLFAGTDTYANNGKAASKESLANVESSSKPAASTPRGGGGLQRWHPHQDLLRHLRELLDQAYTRQEDRRLPPLNVRHLGRSACPGRRLASRRGLDCNESFVGHGREIAGVSATELYSFHNCCRDTCTSSVKLTNSTKICFMRIVPAIQPQVDARLARSSTVRSLTD